MRTICQTVLPFTILLAIFATFSPGQAGEDAPPMLCHDVYFTLKDDSPKARESLVAGCKRFLSEHPGIVWFAAGAIVEEHDREVNDRGFDVALHIVFESKADHDKYQKADAHHKFIEEFQENWESVRVFDSWLSATMHRQGDKPAKRAGKDRDVAAPEELRLPDAASFFAGMIRGKVAAKKDAGVVVAVEEIVKTWKGSKAKQPQALVGKKVLVRSAHTGHHAEAASRFLAGLKVGQSVLLDVAHREGEVLVLLELTQEQRRQVAR